jgi:hypothetical protein
MNPPALGAPLAVLPEVPPSAMEFVRNTVPAVFAELIVPWANAAVANALKHNVATNLFICVFLLIVGLL